MAVTKTFLKKTRLQSVISLVSVGGGNATISMNELALADETIDFANVPAQVNITHTYFATTDKVDVSRNATVVLSLVGQDNWNFAQETGFVINDQNSDDILVDFGAANGTCIISLHKTAGYQEPDQQSLQPRDR